MRLRHVATQCAYTPHGGSLVYSPARQRAALSPAGALLNARTDLFLFARVRGGSFRAKIGRPRAMVRVVRNGVSSAEFGPVIVNPMPLILSASASCAR